VYCDEALNAVEAVASGDVTPDGRLADHYATCPNCSSALAGARALEALLRNRAVPQPSVQFTARAMTQLRRARWRSDQAIDIGFNVAIAAVVLAVLAGIWVVLNRLGMTAVSHDAVSAAAGGFATLAQRIGPSLPLYAAASALLATALVVWWWAERDATL